MTISLIVKLLILISVLVILNAIESKNDKNDKNDIADNDEIEILWGPDLDDINVPLRFFLLGYNLIIIINIIKH